MTASEFPAFQSAEDNEMANNQLLSEILERVESTAFDDDVQGEDEQKETKEAQAPSEAQPAQSDEDVFPATEEDVTNKQMQTSATTTAARPSAPTTITSASNLLPPPPTPNQRKYRQRKNSKAVKNKARERQRLRAKRNTLGINRLRRSSILPTMRMSLSADFSAADCSTKLDRRSSIFGVSHSRIG